LIPYYLSLGYPILIGWDEWGGHWQVIVGYDDLDTEETQDDVLILADPYDTTDHNQDGYYLEAFERLVFGWGAAFDPLRSNVFIIPYLVDTEIPVDTSAMSPDEMLSAVLDALDADIELSNLDGITDAGTAVDIVRDYLSGLGFEAGVDYNIADASVLCNGTSDFSIIPGEVTLTVRVRCGAEYDTVKVVIMTKPASVSITAKDFVSIVETAKNSRVWVLTFNVTLTYANGESRVAQFSINLNGNNANLDGKYTFGKGHVLAGYTLTYDIKGNGSNIKALSIK